MIFFSFSEWFVIALEHEFQRWASSAANSVKCATHMVNLGAATHQFVLLSNRNSASVGSFHDDLLIDRFFSHFCCILFPLSFIDLYISCFYGLQWILYCTWYLFMDYFVIYIPKMVRWRFCNIFTIWQFFLETLFSKQQNIVKTQQFEWCSSFKLNWKAWAFEQLFWWWQKKLCGTPFWRD